MKEEGRSKKEEGICRFIEPQLKTKDPAEGRGIKKNSEDNEIRFFDLLENFAKINLDKSLINISSYLALI
jgi:hypothetical protein